MPDQSNRQELWITKHRLGFDLMGPVLAECCHSLHKYLNTVSNNERSRVLYCARGGLTINRALEMYLTRVNKVSPVLGENFMVSRLAASRLALEVSPEQAAHLLALEFEGRSCAAVASVLSGTHVPNVYDWAQPYRFDIFSQLMSDDPVGRRAHDSMIEQCTLFREHLTAISGDAQVLHLVDTGVFGSIGHFLALGLPDKTIRSVLLFRANYKKLPQLKLPPTVGLVCNQNHYCPWKPRSVSRLYWPFIENFFEPELTSVRKFRRCENGEVISNLQQSDWQSQLPPGRDPIQAGAFDYLSTLNPASTQMITDRSTIAWRALRKRIVFPTLNDTATLGVAPRGVDFGFDELVKFGVKYSNTSVLSKINTARTSMWPEGEIRQFFPKSATIWLHLLEANRIASSIRRTVLGNMTSKLKHNKNMSEQS